MNHILQCASSVYYLHNCLSNRKTYNYVNNSFIDSLSDNEVDKKREKAKVIREVVPMLKEQMSIFRGRTEECIE